MHELSLCRALLDLVEPVARARGATVSRILLRVGPLSGAEPDLLRHAFPIAAAGTCAARAELELRPVPLRVRCLECGITSDASINRLTCAACGAMRTQLLGGNELDILRLELQTSEVNETHV